MKANPVLIFFCAFERGFLGELSKLFSRRHVPKRFFFFRGRGIQIGGTWLACCGSDVLDWLPCHLRDLFLFPENNHPSIQKIPRGKRKPVTRPKWRERAFSQDAVRVSTLRYKERNIGPSEWNFSGRKGFLAWIWNEPIKEISGEYMVTFIA